MLAKVEKEVANLSKKQDIAFKEAKEGVYFEFTLIAFALYSHPSYCFPRPQNDEKTMRM